MTTATTTTTPWALPFELTRPMIDADSVLTATPAPFGGARSLVLADSVSESGDRLITHHLRIALTVWQELLTHKDLSRGSGSSRAVPVAKRIEQALCDPFWPDAFPRAQKGMQPAGYIELGDPDYERQLRRWFAARDFSIGIALEYLADGIHKEIANRVLHQYLWNDAIVSGTTWGSFYSLRLDANAQRQIRQAAQAMKAAMDASTPQLVLSGDWHLPLTGFPGDETLTKVELVHVSTGRSARVSYLTHARQRDVAADLRLFGDLRTDRHLSPFEHPATPSEGRHANYQGWKQARWFVERDLPIPA